MRPSQVLDLQAELIDRMRDQRYQKYVRSFLFDQYGLDVNKMLERDNFIPAKDREWVMTQNINRLIEQLGLSMKVSDAYWVSKDMMDLVNFANESLDDLALFDRDLAPSPYGLAYFDKPLEFMELRGRIMKIHAIQWHPVNLKNGKHGIAFTGFTDVHDPDGVTAELNNADWPVEMLGRWHLNHFDMWETTSRVGPAIVPVSEAHRSASSESDTTPIKWPYSFNIARWLVTYWTMMNQTIVTSTHEPLERLTARRVRRYKLPERVTVVQLRRRKSDREFVGETNVEWQHSWMVKGHWRNQPCGEGRHDVKRIWIHPFIKGPADKPLLQTKKVYALTR